jgi:hypothetical protein
MVDSSEVLQYQRLGVIVVTAVEHCSATGAAAVGKKCVHLWLPARHGQPHRQREPVELDLVEADPGAVEQPDLVLAECQDVEMTVGVHQRQQRSNHESVADGHQFGQPQRNPQVMETVRPQEDCQAVAGLVPQPHEVEESISRFEY